MKIFVSYQTYSNHNRQDDTYGKACNIRVVVHLTEATYFENLIFLAFLENSMFSDCVKFQFKGLAKYKNPDLNYWVKIWPKLSFFHRNMESCTCTLQPFFLGQKIQFLFSNAVQVPLKNYSLSVRINDTLMQTESI